MTLKLLRSLFAATPKRYILRPQDGIQISTSLPTEDGAHGGDFMFLKTKDSEGELYVAVCSICGGNCGQCGTSIGSGVDLNFDYMILKNGWNKPGWGIYRVGR